MTSIWTKKHGWSHTAVVKKVNFCLLFPLPVLSLIAGLDEIHPIEDEGSFVCGGDVDHHDAAPFKQEAAGGENP